MKMRILMVAAAATIFISSCKKDKDDKIPGNTLYGNKASIGNGTARSFLVNKDDHDKMELGLSFDLSAMEGLPTNKTNFLLICRRKQPHLHPINISR
jgi:hypothetical protein